MYKNFHFLKVLKIVVFEYGFQYGLQFGLQYGSSTVQYDIKKTGKI